MSFLGAIDRPTVLQQNANLGSGPWGTVGNGIDLASNMRQFGNPSPMGGMTSLSDPNTNFNTGVQISNYSSVHTHIYQQFTTRFPAEDTRGEMLVFAARDSADGSKGFKTQYEIVSLQALNRYLASAEGRLKYGREKTAQKLMYDFGFGGSYNANIAAHIDSAHVATIVAGRRARVTAVTRGYQMGNDRLSDQILQKVWCFATKRIAPNPKSVYTSSTELSAEEEADRQYWSLELWKNNNGHPPPISLYHSDLGTGDTFKIGVISDFQPSNVYNLSDRAKALQSMDGKKNIATKKYLELMPSMKTVDIMMGMN